jgi:predicted nuclease with TOPRIM domain
MAKMTKAELEKAYAAQLDANAKLSQEVSRSKSLLTQVKTALTAANADIRRLNNPTGPRPAVEVENKRLNDRLQKAYDHHEVTRRRWQEKESALVAELAESTATLRRVTAAAGQAGDELERTIKALNETTTRAIATERRLATVVDLIADLREAEAREQEAVITDVTTFLEGS